MIRTLSIVGLLAAALAIPVASQTPPKKEPDKKPAAKAPSFDEIVAAAVNASPEVKIAEAEVAMAAAKLNAAKLEAAKRVTAVKDALDQAKAEIAAAQATLDMQVAATKLEQQKMEKLKNGGAAPSQFLAAEAEWLKASQDVEKSKAQLMVLQTRLNRMESDWKRYRDEVPATANATHSLLMADLVTQLAQPRSDFTPMYVDWARARTALAGAAPAAGPQADLRAALDKKVDLGKIDGDIPKLTARLLNEAGYAGRVKFPNALNPTFMKDPPKVLLQGSAMPLGSWLQLLADEASDHSMIAEGNPKPRYDFYVRDYGLQMATKETAAPGAIPLSTFWKTPVGK